MVGGLNGQYHDCMICVFFYLGVAGTGLGVLGHSGIYSPSLVGMKQLAPGTYPPECKAD